MNPVEVAVGCPTTGPSHRQPLHGPGRDVLLVPGRSPLLLKDFWTTTVGFDLRRDETFGNERWIEIAPPDGGPVLILAENAQTKLAKIEARQQAAAEAAAERAGCAADGS